MNIREVMEALLAGKKIRRCTWESDEYICLFNDSILNQDNRICGIDIDIDRQYEIYEPPKPKKRYWIWKVSYNGTNFWQKTFCYVDEDGRSTTGELTFSNWDEYEKIKCEDDYIDV